MASQFHLTNEDAGMAFALREGVTRLGRAAGNDIRVEDASVSSHHCELVADGPQLVLRDLGSTNGTFVDGEPTSELRVRAGQILRFGNIEFTLTFAEGAGGPPPAETVRRITLRRESNEPVARTAAIPAINPAAALPMPRLTLSGTAAPVGGPPSGPIKLTPEHVATVLDAPRIPNDDCPRHPNAPVTHVCRKCHARQCAKCPRPAKVGRETLLFCGCGGQCVPIGQLAAAEEPAQQKSKATYAGLWKYPFVGDGWILLVGGTFLYLVIDIATRVTGLLGLAIAVFGYGYLFSYMQAVVTATARGDDHPPDWPDFSDYMEDIVHPFWLLIATVIFCSIPAFVGFMINPLLGMFLAVVGVVYFPMALLGVLMSDSLSALNPLLVLNSIARTAGSYMFACMLLLGLFMWNIFAEFMALQLPDRVFGVRVMWLVWPVFSGFLSLYFTSVSMRVLGLFYRKNKLKLGWFPN